MRVRLLARNGHRMTAATTSSPSAFLLARLADDEAAARELKPPAPWVYATHPAYDGDDDWHMSEHHVRYINSETGYQCRVADVWHENVARFVARHDPARVLAQVAALRAVVEECVEMLDFSEKSSAPILAASVLLALCQPFADHPDFEPSWLAS